MDNFRIDVTSDGNIEPVFQVAFEMHRSTVWQKKATGFAVFPASEDKPTRLVFYWTNPSAIPEYKELPFDVDHATAASLATDWLENVEYPVPPDYDDVLMRKAWRVYNEPWGHVDDRWEAFVAVTPVWAAFGK